MTQAYVHGYDVHENTRLCDQAETLADLLHGTTRYTDGSHVLEAGCGVGAQTITLALNSPTAQITAIDISAESLATAQQRVTDAGIDNVTFQKADILQLPFAPDTFDHVFVCFVLEHLTNPHAVLTQLKTVLKPGGTITVIEGDHGSTFFHPHSREACRAIECLVELQAEGGGDANIGRTLFPLISAAGYHDVRVSPLVIYADDSRPRMVDGFTRKTFAAMIEGIRESVIQQGMMDPDTFEKGVRDLFRTAEPDGVFCYTFFKAVATI
jgi:SAM-dependent methyltransferase